MNYGNIKECDIADGPGVRVSLFVSGCRHHCKGCFNEETWNFNYGQPYTEETEAEILNSLDSNFIQGFSLLGGEPFEPENQVELVKLLKKVRESKPQIDIERGLYFTKSFQKTEGQPLILRWAKALKYYAENASIYIDENQLAYIYIYL